MRGVPFWKTERFKKEKKKWDKILRQSGFEDIERRRELPRIDPRTTYLRDVEARTHYFQTATAYLNETKFKTPAEKKIWALHCDGHSVRKIAKFVRIHFSKVFRCLKDHRSRAGLLKHCPHKCEQQRGSEPKTRAR